MATSRWPTCQPATAGLQWVSQAGRQQASRPARCPPALRRQTAASLPKGDRGRASRAPPSIASLRRWLYGTPSKKSQGQVPLGGQAAHQGRPGQSRQPQGSSGRTSLPGRWAPCRRRQTWADRQRWGYWCPAQHRSRQVGRSQGTHGTDKCVAKQLSRLWKRGKGQHKTGQQGQEAARQYEGSKRKWVSCCESQPVALTRPSILDISLAMSTWSPVTILTSTPFSSACSSHAQSTGHQAPVLHLRLRPHSIVLWKHMEAARNPASHGRQLAAGQQLACSMVCLVSERGGSRKVSIPSTSQVFWSPSQVLATARERMPRVPRSCTCTPAEGSVQFQQRIVTGQPSPGWGGVHASRMVAATSAPCSLNIADTACAASQAQEAPQ
jgi:hypothetical protein